MDPIALSSTLRHSPVGRLLAPSLVFLWGQASAGTPAGTRRLLLDLAPSLPLLLCSLGQVCLLALCSLYSKLGTKFLIKYCFRISLQVLSRVGSTLGEEQQWLQQLERLLALLGGLVIAANLRLDTDDAGIVDAHGRHARWLDGREGGGGGILATMPAPELLGTLLPHVSIADDFRASVLSAAATTAVVAGTPRTTATAIATPPRVSTRKTLLAPRSVIHIVEDIWLCFY